MKKITLITQAIILTVGLLFTNSVFAIRALDLSCEHLSIIENRYLRGHINYSKLGRNLEVRTVDQFIKTMDGFKINLTKKDVKKIKTSFKGIFKKVKNKDCSAIYAAYDLYKKRVTERVQFAKSHISDKKFKYSDKTKLTIDADKRKYAANDWAAKKFQKNYIQFQISNYLAADEKLPKAIEYLGRKYDRVLRRINDFKRSEVLAIYVNSFANALDPHSSFFSKEALEEFTISMSLSLEGIGASLSFDDGFTVIEQLIPGGAAIASGELKPKDKIVAVGQEDKKGKEKEPVNVIEMDLKDVVRLIRGKKGTKVRLSIVRKEEKKNKRFDVVLKRRKIKLEDQAASIDYIDRNTDGKKYKVGLLNLPTFYAGGRRDDRSSAKDIKRLIVEAKTKKVDAIVFDLSTNGGGSLSDAVKIAGLFFKTGNVVKQSQKDFTKGAIPLADMDPTVDWSGPLIINVSRVSASASEIVSGALQDYKRAVVVGADHTFGKGTVQSVEHLERKLGAIKTTVGMFFTSGGYSTQHRGVVSDIQFPSMFSTEDTGEKTLDYSLPPKKIKSFLSKEAYVLKGPGEWKPVNKSIISKLKVKSSKRVKKNKEFKKIIRNMAKIKSRGKTMTLKEFHKVDPEEEKEKKKDKNKVLSKKERKEKYLKRADIQEAVDIAVDLAQELSKKKLTYNSK